MRTGKVGVKVCGVTTVEDALICGGAGVDWIGLNFSATSVRQVPLDRARDITRAVRAKHAGMRFIGLFVNQPAEEIETIVNTLMLDGVQLHGRETPSEVAAIRAPWVIKALPVAPGFNPESVRAYPCDAILLDAWSPTAAGGTGASFPWEIAAAVRPLVRCLLLAGGLHDGNVARAIAAARPDLVDVCSGVESAPGRKDGEKVRRFVEETRAALQPEGVAS